MLRMFTSFRVTTRIGEVEERYGRSREVLCGEG